MKATAGPDEVQFERLPDGVYLRGRSPATARFAAKFLEAAGQLTPGLVTRGDGVIRVRCVNGQAVYVITAEDEFVVWGRLVYDERNPT